MIKQVLYLLLAALVGGTPANAQQQKIKVFLLGTFHFEQTDTTEYDIKSTKRQKEVADLCDKLAKFRPEKIFIEQNPEFEYVNKRDSLYGAYLQGTYTLRRNEIYQVAFRLGKALGHQHIYECDHPGQWGTYFTPMSAYALGHGQADILHYKAPGTTRPLTKTVNADSIRDNSTVLGYMRWLNSNAVQATSQAAYVNTYPRLGNTDVFPTKPDSTYFVGTKLLADWYRRNVWIYSKIINQLDYSEKRIFLIIGNDHIPILRHLFESNPYFEVVDAEKWL